MSRVELVKFLIESNFYEVPSIEDLMSAQTARSVRLRRYSELTLALDTTSFEMLAQFSANWATQSGWFECVFPSISM